MHGTSRATRFTPWRLCDAQNEQRSLCKKYVETALMLSRRNEVDAGITMLHTAWKLSQDVEIGREKVCCAVARSNPRQRPTLSSRLTPHHRMVLSLT